MGRTLDRRSEWRVFVNVYRIIWTLFLYGLQDCFFELAKPAFADSQFLRRFAGCLV
jgi:hypothetical protein